jgi:hypothetical protein
LTQRSPATGHSAAITALKADLARSRKTSSTTAQQLANLRAANRRLGTRPQRLTARAAACATASAAVLRRAFDDA